MKPIIIANNNQNIVFIERFMWSHYLEYDGIERDFNIERKSIVAWNISKNNNGEFISTPILAPGNLLNGNFIIEDMSLERWNYHEQAYMGIGERLLRETLILTAKLEYKRLGYVYKEIT